MDIIKTIPLDSEHYMTIVHENDPLSPRDGDNLSKLCIREHRNYSFPNELDIQFQDDNFNLKDEVESLQNTWYVFLLDCYEHSSITFSLKGKGMQCQFDTSRDVGFICISKENTGEDEALGIAEQEIATYNAYLNGEVYGFYIYKTFPLITKDGVVYHANAEYEDGCSGIYELENIKDYIDPKYYEAFTKGLLSN